MRAEHLHHVFRFVTEINYYLISKSWYFQKRTELQHLQKAISRIPESYSQRHPAPHPTDSIVRFLFSFSISHSERSHPRTWSDGQTTNKRTRTDQTLVGRELFDQYKRGGERENLNNTPHSGRSTSSSALPSRTTASYFSPYFLFLLPPASESSGTRAPLRLMRSIRPREVNVKICECVCVCVERLNGWMCGYSECGVLKRNEKFWSGQISWENGIKTCVRGFWRVWIHSKTPNKIRNDISVGSISYWYFFSILLVNMKWNET